VIRLADFSCWHGESVVECVTENVVTRTTFVVPVDIKYTNPLNVSLTVICAMASTEEGHSKYVANNYYFGDHRLRSRRDHRASNY
jgi:hypothetical protein